MGAFATVVGYKRLASLTSDLLRMNKEYGIMNNYIQHQHNVLDFLIIPVNNLSTIVISSSILQ